MIIQVETFDPGKKSSAAATSIIENDFSNSLTEDNFAFFSPYTLFMEAMKMQRWPFEAHILGMQESPLKPTDF
jgi:hypothetical protein